MNKTPNIITIVSHDLGQHLHCYGVDTVQSPNLDAMAENGLLFEKSFCTAPQCSPSRASIMTGRFPHSNGVMGLTHGLFGWNLHDEEQTLPQLLQGAGYRTIHANWQHYSTRKRENMGYDEYATCGGNAETASASFGNWLEENHKEDQPFYAHLCFFEPHRTHFASDFGHAWDSEKGVNVPPFLVDELSAREEFASFQGGVRGLDRGMGVLVDSLRKQGLLDNTLIIFIADHGIPFPRAKCSLYDPGLEAACLMHWPNGIAQPGRRIKPMVSHVDILPTVLDLVGIDVPDGLQGRSLLPLLEDKSYEARTEIFGEMTYHGYCDPVRCIRTDTHKLIVNFTVAPSFMDSSQTWRPKTIPKVPEDPEFAFHPPVELYDLQADPLEHNNIAYTEDSDPTSGGGPFKFNENPEILAIRNDLLRRLHQWMQDTRDPLLEGIPTPTRHTDVMQLMSKA